MNRDRRFSLLKNARAVLERRETIRFLVGANLKAGHRNKVLGNLWNLLDPLLFLGVYYLVFGIGLRQASGDPEGFVIYLSIGVLAFRFFDGTVAQAASCLRAHRGIILEVPFPKAILPISLCFSRLYDFLWGLFVLIGIMLLMGRPPTLALAWLPLILLLEFVLCLGLAFIVAYLGAYLADMANITVVVTRLLFFLSPIFYFSRSEFGHAGLIPPDLLRYYMLNPLAGLFDAYRDAILWGRTPDPLVLCYVAGLALVGLLCGFALFSRGEATFAKVI